jgi:AcrR family transcriptional regulator
MMTFALHSAAGPIMNIRSNGRLNWKTMSRPAENTRGAIIKAAVYLFAEKGFQSTSVRDIVVKARVEQAAINYYFKGKDGLYLEVLKTAFEKLTEHAGFDPEKLKSLSREEALRSFVHRQLRPLLSRRDEPLHSPVRLGERPSQQDLSQVHGNEYGLLSDHCGRYRAPISTSGRREAGRLMRGHLEWG